MITATTATSATTATTATTATRPQRRARSATVTERIFGEPDSDSDSDAASGAPEADDAPEAEFDLDCVAAPDSGVIRAASWGLRERVDASDRFVAGAASGPPRRKARTPAARAWDDASPSARAGHTLTKLGADLVLFGGLGRAQASTSGPRTGASLSRLTLGGVTRARSLYYESPGRTRPPRDSADVRERRETTFREGSSLSPR